MSTGNPDFTPKISQIKPEHKEKISPSWFYGIGNKERGILSIGFSKKFYKIGAEKIQQATGFSIEEFEAEKKKLEEQYTGKQDAPFEFELRPNLSFAARK